MDAKSGMDAVDGVDWMESAKRMLAMEEREQREMMGEVVMVGRMD